MRLHFAGLSVSFVRRSNAFSLRAHGVHGVLTECPWRSWSPHSIANAWPRRSQCVLLITQSHGVDTPWSLDITKCSQSQGVLGVPMPSVALSRRCHGVATALYAIPQRSARRSDNFRNAVGTRSWCDRGIKKSCSLLETRLF